MQVSHGTLIVTGASRGIGAAIATLAGERGFSVAVNFSTGESEARAIVGKNYFRWRERLRDSSRRFPRRRHRPAF
jgi:NAD(P)-dependent dehydrogenase (short-subunit alcohol dehydrogenase family)